ncbi:MAG: leucine-rich repeat domain-containing protein [Clostridiales bacterium]|nr:leucine-rich repeat domain-containing protein [Clostridiales bacterium]
MRIFHPRILTLPALFLLLTSMGCLAGAEEETPALSYEVKFLLDSDRVLGEDHLLKEEVKALFGISAESEKYPDKYEEIEALYLETMDKTYYKEGWINRIRWKGEEGELERTYKRRFSFDGMSEEDVEAALNLAKNAGFEPGSKYEAQIDWSQDKMTLSFTKLPESTELREQSPELAKMTTGEAVHYLLEDMPEEETDRTSILRAQKAGPVTYHKIKGVFNDEKGKKITKVTIEIWPVEKKRTKEVTYTAELSFKVEGKKAFYQTADSYRKQLEKFMEENELLSEDDSLKTTMILDAYIRPYPETIAFSLPAGLTKIGSDAFAGCPVSSVLVPDKTGDIVGNPFSGAEDLIVIGALDSAADTFANQFGYSFIPE